MHLSKFELLLIPGFLTLPTAYVTGNPVECVLHPSLWNDSGVWDAVGVGQMPIGSSIGNDNDDDAEFVEENIGYPVSSVRDFLLHSICRRILHIIIHFFLTHLFCTNARKENSVITKKCKKLGTNK